MARWQFKDETPLDVKVVATVFFVALLLVLALAWGIPEWSPRVADSIHSVPIAYRGGTAYFVQPWLAKAERDADWLAAGSGAAVFLLFLVHRNELERVG